VRRDWRGRAAPPRCKAGPQRSYCAAASRPSRASWRAVATCSLRAPGRRSSVMGARLCRFVRRDLPLSERGVSGCNADRAVASRSRDRVADIGPPSVRSLRCCMAVEVTSKCYVFLDSVRFESVALLLGLHLRMLAAADTARRDDAHASAPSTTPRCPMTPPSLNRLPQVHRAA
jgi:hypothetical protein